MRALMLIVGALVLLSGAAASAQDPEGWVRDGTARVTRPDGAFELNGSEGWMRLNAVHSDFVVEFQFRLADDDSVGAFSFHARPGYQGDASPFYGYHVLLGPNEALRVEAAGPGLGAPIVVGSSDAASAREWHRARVEVQHRLLRVAVDERPATVYDSLEEYGGYLVIQARRGTVAFRDVRVARLPPGDTQFAASLPTLRDAGVVRPAVVRDAKPFYPIEPERQRIQGTVLLDVVVLANGAVGDVRTARSLHPDLDEAAMAAARKWHFSPGTRDGEPSPMVVTIEMTFTTRR